MDILTRYEARAAAWDRAGRTPDLLETREMEMLSMFCWCESDGCPKDVSDALIAFVNASIKAYDDRPDPRGLGNALRERSHCERCGARYMLCNFWWCTDCHARYCVDCVGSFPEGENGNRREGCGGELVGYHHPLD